jgi:hypothetical protein
MMTFETFKMILDQQRQVDQFLDKLYKMGVDLIDCEVFNTTTPLTKEIFRLSFGDEEWENVYDWYTWYLWELPMLKEKKKKDEDNGNEVDEAYAWDGDKNPIDVSSDENFFAYINKTYNKRESTTHKLKT